MANKYITIEKGTTISAILDLLEEYNVDPYDASLEAETYEDQDSMGGSWTGATVHLVIPEETKK